MSIPHSHFWDENCGPECPRHDPVEPYDSTREELVEDTRRLDAPYPHEIRTSIHDSRGVFVPSEQHGKHEFRHDNSPGKARVEINPQGTKVYDVDGDLVEPSSWKIGPARIMENPGKTVQKWADEAMFTATPIDASSGPKVYLLNMTPDPLGAIAAACKGYEGKFVHDLSEITDDERNRYFEQVQKTHLRAPFEFVHFHFLIEGVTRGFTHQMVRQRTATYVQESTRFAVKEDMPVGLPPSLAGTVDLYEHQAQLGWEFDREDVLDGSPDYDREPEAQRQRDAWDLAVEDIGVAYRKLVESGMPAEDARGLLPTNLLTRIQYRTDLKSLIEHAGNRLCTQAQFEWRTVFSKIVEAIRMHESTYTRTSMVDIGNGPEELKQDMDGYWQMDKTSKVFRPICYLTGKCEFKADFDRKCSIRERVDKFAEHGVPSSEWGPEGCSPVRECAHSKHGISAIQPAEWLLNPGAAR